MLLRNCNFYYVIYKKIKIPIGHPIKTFRKSTPDAIWKSFPTTKDLFPHFILRDRLSAIYRLDFEKPSRRLARKKEESNLECDEEEKTIVFLLCFRFGNILGREKQCGPVSLWKIMQMYQLNLTAQIVSPLTRFDLMACHFV